MSRRRDLLVKKGSAQLGCLCFTAATAGSTVSMASYGTTTLGQNFKTSTDGINWTDFIPGTTTITLANRQDKIYFKGNNPNGVNESTSNYYAFVMTGTIVASGNIMSLIDDGNCNTLVIPNDYCFNYLFEECTSLAQAPDLPATTLTSRCYMGMFYKCTYLTTPPTILPATTLAPYCYNNMFRSCGLTIAPTLPAQSLDNCSYCYAYMFSGCKFRTPPALPATVLADRCYDHMFSACKNLSSVPALPATTMKNGCYMYMFYDCSILATPPALPAATLAENCYFCMFYMCSKLSKVPALPATTLFTKCYYMMFASCTSLIVSDSSSSGYSNAWRIPTSGAFTNALTQDSMFTSCSTGGGRASNSLVPVSGSSATYYVASAPVA